MRVWVNVRVWVNLRVWVDVRVWMDVWDETRRPWMRRDDTKGQGCACESARVNMHVRGCV